MNSHFPLILTITSLLAAAFLAGQNHGSAFLETAQIKPEAMPHAS